MGRMCISECHVQYGALFYPLFASFNQLLNFIGLMIIIYSLTNGNALVMLKV